MAPEAIRNASPTKGERVDGFFCLQVVIVLRSCGAGVDGVGSGVAVARLASDFDFADVGVLRRAGVGGGGGRGR
jgi:hypothetical protein